jgi:hypothetical protein
MKHFFFAVTALIAFSVAPACAGDGPKSSDKGSDKGSKAAEGSKGEAGSGAAAYSVVQVGDNVKVVKTSEVASLREKVNEDFKKGMKSYEDAKKEAQKQKKKFNDTKPVKPVFKEVATALKTEEAANSLRDKTAAKLDAQKKKAREEKSK